MCLSFLFVASLLRAQTPAAEFSASQQTGCSPFAVKFTDQSSGNPKFWNWDFGNGQISNLQNPSVTYSAPGTYTVTLVVRNANGTNGITKTDYITVFASPVASFSADRLNACVPSTIQFTDKSVDNSGSIVSWEWNFGDGTTSTQQNPSHSYTESGFYTVSLKITSSSGCSASSSRFRYIRIFAGVEADFNFKEPPTCEPPFVVNFDNITSGPGAMTYAWNFGNGSTSTTEDPSSSFTAPGNYEVSLTATSEFGCSNSTSKTISIQGYNTDFTGPDTICINSTASFQNTSTDIPQSVLWTLGDSTSTENNPVATFNQAGTFPIKLVQQFPNCADSVIRNLVVMPKPVVQFNANNPKGCKVPHTVNFIDQTANAVSWQWDFGDGSSSTEKNPQHVYQSTGTFAVKLKVIDRFGCENEIIKDSLISIIEPSVSITNAPAGGCIPFVFRPTIQVNSLEPIASYLWDFGDGNTSTASNPSHTYSDSGTYNLQLRITTTNGCTDTVFLRNGIRTGKPPVTDFTVAVSDSCASSAVSFTDLSQPGVSAWSWDFGDGNRSSEKNPTHNYTDTGYFNISLTAFNNGCGKTLSKPNLVYVKPPVAAFDFDVNCNSGTLVAFRNQSITDNTKLVKYLWSFGDQAQSIDSVANPQFNYPGPGVYSVSLTVINDSCSSTITKEVRLPNEVADFSASKLNVCRNDRITLTATGSNPANISSYQWKIGTNAYVTGPANYTFTAGTIGTYDISLVITDINGCTDTLSRSQYISVTGPTAAFSINQAEACTGTDVTFTDESVSSGQIVKWTWDFGDSTIREFTAPPFNHNYSDSGTYSIRLTVTDQNGCSHSVSKDQALHVSKVIANFSKDTTLYCPGIPVQFKDSSIGENLRYTWTFGDGNSSTEKDPVNVFPDSESSYTVSLWVENNTGCADSIVRNDLITIRAPKPDFEIRDSITLCPPFETVFFMKSSDYETFYWDPGDGSDLRYEDTVRHFYNSYDTFAVKLVLIGHGGCRDSLVKNVYVINPNATGIDYSPLNSCNELTVDFNLQPPAYSTFKLAFGDGKVDSSGSTTLTHFYENPGIYNPVLTATDPTGCIVNVGGKNPIRVIGAQPLFGIDEKEFCDSGTVYFTNYTIGNDPVTGYTWDFGDGTISNDKDVVHTYSSGGLYIPKLTVTTRSGCTDFITDTIRVYNSPRAAISVPDTICVNDPVNFFGSLIDPAISAVDWNWSFGNGQSSNIMNPVTVFTSPGNYTVTLNTKVPFGCSATTTRDIVVRPKPSVSFSEDPVTISGRGILIPVSYEGNIVDYKWTPPTNLTCTDCPFPVASPKFTTKYSVTVTDSAGCSNSGDVNVIIICHSLNLFIPTSFSPNRDGSNDILYPHGTGLTSIKSFRVFNRWGQMVFEKYNFPPNQSSSGWDGTYNGKDMVSDVYVFSIEIICDNGEIYHHKGDVMLLR